MAKITNKKAQDCPFFVRQSGLGYESGQGAIVGYDDRAGAEEDAADRNKRAEALGLQARYEVVE